MLTIEYEPDGALEISLDVAGRDELVRVLQELVPGDHEHLATPSWGGDQLTENFQFPELVQVHQLTVQLIEAVVEVDRSEPQTPADA